MNCIVCSKESESPIGFIVFYEIYNEFLDRDGSLRPMGVFCSMRCINAYSSQQIRLEQKAGKKKKK